MELFVFDWGTIADLSVEPPVVEPVDVFGDGHFELVDVRPGPFIADEFGFEQRVERLSEGIVIGLTG